jgi:hypothetical protein
MATFKNYFSNGVGSSNTLIYTAPAANCTVIGLSMCNISNNTILGSLFISSGGSNTYMIRGCSIPFGSAQVPIGGDQKLVLQENDEIYCWSNTSGSLDVILSVLEV